MAIKDTGMRNIRNKDATVPIIQTLIDTAYDNVKLVADNIDSVNAVADAISQGDYNSFLTAVDLNTLDKLNAIVENATLVDGTTLKSAAYAAVSEFATAAAGVLAASAIQPGEGNSQLHNDSGYITGYTEIDPLFTISAASGIVAQNLVDWDTAYAWGDHGVVGYITDAPVDGNRYVRQDAAWALISTSGEVNDLTQAVVWTNIPIANVPTGTSGSTVALGDHTHSNYLTDAPADGEQYVRKDAAWTILVGGGAEVVLLPVLAVGDGGELLQQRPDDERPEPRRAARDLRRVLGHVVHHEAGLPYQGEAYQGEAITSPT